MSQRKRTASAAFLDHLHAASAAAAAASDIEPSIPESTTLRASSVATASKKLRATAVDAEEATAAATASNVPAVSAPSAATLAALLTLAPPPPPPPPQPRPLSLPLPSAAAVRREQQLALEPPFESPVKARHDDDDDYEGVLLGPGLGPGPALEPAPVLEHGLGLGLETGAGPGPGPEQKKQQRDDADDAAADDDDDDEGDMRLKNFMEMGHEDLARLTYFMWKVAVVGFSREERSVMLERVKKMQGKLEAGERAGVVLKAVVKEGFEEDEGDEEEDEGYEEEGEGDDGEEEEDGGEDEEDEEDVDARWTYKRIENWLISSI
ncbi:hypothetical protein SLS58_001572 [Diplodia intermedia]|uniref:Uncharacterized protein n=1 Tax=Diplodia intermedia TaxID=856260 RepID=A0ABR3U2K9_9PEZI